METDEFFTIKEKDLLFSLYRKLLQLSGETLQKGDCKKLKTHLVNSIQNNRIQRDIFGLNPIIKDMQTAVIVADNSGKVAEYDGIAFGCPAMGAENLEESEFEPMFTEVEGSLSGKKIALFGSYGWGSGEWMADWEERSKAAGAVLATDSVICQEAPDDDAVENCKKLGAALA